MFLKQKYFFLFLIPIVIASALLGCRKDQDTFVPYPSSVKEIALSLRDAQTASSNTTFLLKGAIPDTTLVTASGVRVILRDVGDLFVYQSGMPVPNGSCAELKIVVKEALHNYDKIAHGISTLSPTGQLLETGGMAYIEASCDGQILNIKPTRKLNVQFPLSSSSMGVSDMGLYQATNDTLLGHWHYGNQIVYQALWNTLSTSMHGYDLFLDSLGWVGAAKLVGTSTVKCNIVLPNQFTLANTTAFMLFPALHAIAPLKEDASAQDFSFSRAPAGMEAQIITVSKIGDRWWLGQAMVQTEHAKNMGITPVEMTSQQIIEFIREL